MSEGQKKLRSIAEIQADYQRVCVKAGHLEYQIYTFKQELELVNKELRDLNLEAAASAQAEEAAKEMQDLKAKQESEQKSE